MNDRATLMSLSSINHTIKGRDSPKNVFITPPELAKSHIKMIDTLDSDLWLDPCKNSGSYYNHFPTEKKEYCEILEGKDFFEYKGSPDVICDNPPYSMLDKWFDKVIKINPRVYSTLIGVNNLTARRIEKFERAGFGIKKMKMLKVFEWFGLSYIIVFEKGAESVIEIDRKVYREEKPKTEAVLNALEKRKLRLKKSAAEIPKSV